MKKVLSLIIAFSIILSIFAGLNMSATAVNTVNIEKGTIINSESSDTYVFIPEKSGSYIISGSGQGYISSLYSDYDMEPVNPIEPIALDYESTRFAYNGLEAGKTYFICTYFGYDWEKDDLYTSFEITDIKYTGSGDLHLVDSISLEELAPIHLGDEIQPVNVTVDEVEWINHEQYSADILSVTDTFFVNINDDDNNYSNGPDWDNISKTTDKYFSGKYYLIAKFELQEGYTFDELGTLMHHIYIRDDYSTSVKRISDTQIYIAFIVEAERYTDENGITYELNKDKKLTVRFLPENYSNNELTINQSVKINEENFEVSQVKLREKNAFTEKVNLPKTITEIAYGSFSGYTKLKDIELPEKLERIGASAFCNTSALEEFKVDANNEHFTSKDGVVYSKDESELVRYPVGKKDESFNVPKTVKTISEAAFATCRNVQHIIIPDSVETIEKSAFFASDVQSVSLPGSIKCLADNLFKDAHQLNSIVLPEGIEEIGYNSFKSCENLEKVYLPKSLKSVADSFEKDQKLTDIYYAGSEEDWKEISITENGNEYFLAANIHYNYDYSSHVHSYTDVVTPPTCTEKGYTTHTCECGDVKVDTYLNALGHKTVKDKAVSATCTKAGKTAGSHCSVCGKVIVAQKAIKALGHKTVKDKAVSATCTKAGKTAGSHCSVCGKVIVAQKAIKALGHKWDGGKVTKKATPTATGIKTYSCKACSAKKTVVIPKCAKYANTMVVKGKMVSVSYAKLKNANQFIAGNSALTISKPQGALSYAKISGNKSIGISKSKGMIQVKKGLKKGTYKISVKVTAAGNASYKAASKSATITVVVK